MLHLNVEVEYISRLEINLNLVYIFLSVRHNEISLDTAFVYGIV